MACIKKRDERMHGQPETNMPRQLLRSKEVGGINISHSVQFIKKIKIAYLPTPTQNSESGDSKQIIF